LEPLKNKIFETSQRQEWAAYAIIGSQRLDISPSRDLMKVLRDRIAQGWWKLNDDGTKTFVGSPPRFDLYWGVRSHAFG
jgi:hypothetical protein